MYVVSDKFKSAIESTSRSMSCKAYLRGIEFSVDKILKLDIEDNINNGDYFTIGEVPSRSLTIEMIGVQGLVEGDEIKPYYGVEVSPGEFEYVPCGVFYVDSLTINKDKISATCYDKMLSLEEEYTPNIAIPVTLTEIMNDICQQKGIEFEGELPNITLSKSIKGYSYREMIGFIASFCGGNAKFNRLGKLVIQQYAQTGKIVNPDVCASFEHKDVYTVSAIACKFGDVANTRGDSSANCVNFTNPYVDDSNIDSIFNLLNGLTFTAANFKYKGDPSVDSGDLITINDVKGNSHVVLVSTQDFKFSGGLTSEITSIGEGKGANAYKQYKFKNKKSITELNVELGLIQGIISEVQEKQEDTYTKTETETLIEAKAGEISLSVAKNEVNNLQIGGANLLLNSDAKKQLDRAESGWYNQIFYTLVDDYVGLTLNNDTTFVLSFMVDRTGNTEFECFDTITFDNGWAHRWTRSDIDKITLIQGSTYKFVMKPKTLPKGATIADKLYFIAENYYGGGLFYKLMLTEGEKAFDWQPAFKDIEASIARIDVKSDEINLSVNRVKENLSNNYPTNSQMNSALQQKANEITLSVSETYTTKDEVKGTYATKSELSQSSDNLTIKFSNSSSGGNLVANGDFLNGRDNWWVWGDAHYYLDSIPDCSIGARLGSNGAGGFVSNQFRIKPNTKYTLSFDGYVEVNVIGGYATIEMLDGNGGNRGVALIHGIGRTLEKNIIHLTTGSDVGTDWKAQVVFKHDGSRVPNNGYLMVLKNVCLTEGHNSGQYVPSTKTLYEGVTRIDKDGITVTHSADSSYSTMSATGFTFNSHGSGHRYHNLMKQGWIDTISFGGIGANGWSTTITLPPEFKNKPFSVIPAITYVGCPHVADALKMFEINIPHGEVNYANGTFKIYIYASGLWAEGLSTTYSVEVRATWVAIA